MAKPERVAPNSQRKSNNKNHEHEAQKSGSGFCPYFLGLIILQVVYLVSLVQLKNCRADLKAYK